MTLTFTAWTYGFLEDKKMAPTLATYLLERLRQPGTCVHVFGLPRATGSNAIPGRLGRGTTNRSSSRRGTMRWPLSMPSDTAQFHRDFGVCMATARARSDPTAHERPVTTPSSTHVPVVANRGRRACSAMGAALPARSRPACPVQDVARDVTVANGGDGPAIKLPPPVPCTVSIFRASPSSRPPPSHPLRRSGTENSPTPRRPTAFRCPFVLGVDWFDPPPPRADDRGIPRPPISSPPGNMCHPRRPRRSRAPGPMLEQVAELLGPESQVPPSLQFLALRRAAYVPDRRLLGTSRT